MSNKSPVEAYLDACSLYLEIQELDDHPARLRRLLAQRAVLKECFQRLMAAADTQDPEVWLVLGGAFTTGRGTTRDRAEAGRWYHRAAEAGHPRAMVRLAIFLQHSASPPDPVAAVRWLRKAAEKGDSGGMAFLGFAYRNGTGVPCDHTEAVRWFIKAVEAGDDTSMIHVGRVYARHLSSPAQALNWFLRAAAAGLDESIVELAILYDEPNSQVYDPAEAVKWYRVLAEHSEGTSRRALLALAQHYREGIGVPRDLETAKLWLRRLLQVVPKWSPTYREASEQLMQIDEQLL